MRRTPASEWRDHLKPPAPRVVGLEEALMVWNGSARLENGIVGAKNPKWIAQAHELLKQAEWERVKVVLQRVVDSEQELLRRLTDRG